MLELPIIKTTRGESFVRFHPTHLSQIDMREEEAKWSATDPNYLSELARSADLNRSWSVKYQGRILLCFGIRHVYPGSGEAWMIAGKGIEHHAISLVKGARKIFSDLLENKGYFRIQIGVMTDNDSAFKFARTIGFEVEGIMRNFGAPGAKCYLMSRISKHGH